MMISTSPVCAKYGNSFCGAYDEPPWWDRLLRCRRVVVAREVMERGPRTVRVRSEGSGEKTMGEERLYEETLADVMRCS